MPIISVIIVIWNSKKELFICLESLSRQTLQDFEIIIVDNGSSDNAIDDLKNNWPSLDLKTISLEHNQGFAFSNNLGVKNAQGQWVALLNADAFPEPDWLYQLYDAIRKFPEYSLFSSRQIQANCPEMLDGEGDAYHVSGLAWRRKYDTPFYPPGAPEEVFSPCAAAALYSRARFLEVGGFDEDFFAYHEDVDLGFRLRLMGERCLYIPSAVVHHIGSASFGKMSDFSIYFSHRNLVWTFVKNMPTLLLWLYLPLHIAISVYLFFNYMLKGRSLVFLRAKKDALMQIPKILRKRRKIQDMRAVTTFSIHSAMRKNWLEPLYIYHQRRGLRK